MNSKFKLKNHRSIAFLISYKSVKLFIHRNIQVFIIAGIGIVLLLLFQLYLDNSFSAANYSVNNEKNSNNHITSGEVSSNIKSNELIVFIEVEDKTLYLVQGNNCIRKYGVSTGKSGLPSPIGMWKIVEKGDWGEGFGGRWMGFNVPWGKYGIHGTLPGDAIGAATSQGCIRMDNNDVAELYDMVPYGTTVVIVNGSFGPFGQAFSTIQPGDRGADVYAIQLRLKELGFFKGWVSGIYEDDLKYALHKFQKSKKLHITNTITKGAWEAMGFREFE